MTDKTTYGALEAQVRALTKEVSDLKQSQRDLHVVNDYLNTLVTFKSVYMMAN